jgi:hypothetical protein
VRFIGYIPAVLRGIKVEWDIPVEITDEIRRAMHPQDEIERLRAGRLRRPFHVPSHRLGRRSAGVPQREEVVHPNGALIFANETETWFWVEAEERGVIGGS